MHVRFTDYTKKIRQFFNNKNDVVQKINNKGSKRESAFSSNMQMKITIKKMISKS